ncbi:hypothetical protein BDW72DRAFT_198133 [Aspergillus terricola var. indicus]
MERRYSDDINAIKNAPDVIADLKDELAAVEAVLLALNNAHESQLESLASDAKTALQLAIANCQKACDKFRKKLALWTKHSDGKIHWRDRVRVGLFAEGTVKALSEQLSCCKATINAAVSTATLISSATLSSTSNAIQKTLQDKENEIYQKMVKVNEQIMVAQKTLQEATEAQSIDDQNSDMIEQLQGQQDMLNDCRELLEKLFVETRQVRTGQRITKVEMSDGGRLLVGLINHDNDNGEIHQDIHDIRATNNGKGIVGVVKGFDVNAFLND